MPHDLLLQLLTACYAVCNAMRLLFYVPQMVAVVRDPSGAHAISLVTWGFWSFSHAVTAVYCHAVANDLLLAGMMWGNAAGCFAVVGLTVMKRRRAHSLPSPGRSRQARPVGRFHPPAPFVPMRRT